MTPLDLIGLPGLMARTSGRPEIAIGLVDGPVASHAGLDRRHTRELQGRRGEPEVATSAACVHGTFVAGILAAPRGTIAPSICPDCTLLVRPIFAGSSGRRGEPPGATCDELARAIGDCLDAGARVVNLSAAIMGSAVGDERALTASLDRCARRGALVVAASGNQGRVGSTAITRHPGVIPVVAYDQRGRPMAQSNLGRSIGTRGVGAPGDRIVGLGPTSASLTLSGTSVAAPFVTGTIALLWSEFPKASTGDIRSALLGVRTVRRAAVVPPLLHAWSAYQQLAATHGGFRHA